jgi:hypothetical protein
MSEIKIEFFPNGQRTIEYDTIDQGLIIIDTDDKYIVVYCTVDGDHAEFFTDVNEMLKTLQEYYGDDLVNEIRKYLPGE